LPDNWHYPQDDLIELQNAHHLVSGNINAVLLVTSFSSDDNQTCLNKGIRLIKYNPGTVLETFYNYVAGVSGFLTIRPIDLGVWHIHVINRVLYLLSKYNTPDQLSEAIGIAINTVKNHLKFAMQLGLVRKYEGKYLLTDLGIAYVEARDPSLSVHQLSDPQIDILRKHIIKDPFSSNIVFGIYSLVESIFTLARNSYPVAIQDLMYYYKETVGKRYDWSTERSAFLGVNAFSNFAIELGLIAMVGNKLMLTPAGFRFILMLQLHKGIRIIDSLGERVYYD